MIFCEIVCERDRERGKVKKNVCWGTSGYRGGSTAFISREKEADILDLVRRPGNPFNSGHHLERTIRREGFSYMIFEQRLKVTLEGG